MELEKLIRERRTVQRFEDRPVPLELVEELLETAVWVPNHKLTQPWRFVVVQGEGRRRLAEIAGQGALRRESDPEKAREMSQKRFNKFAKVPLLLAVVMKENEDPVVREEDYASACCIIHNFSLLAWQRGIGLVWETYPLLKSQEFREALGVAPDEKIVGSLHMGYPAQVPEARPRIPAERLITVIDGKKERVNA
jgi:nitroreductase